MVRCSLLLAISGTLLLAACGGVGAGAAAASAGGVPTAIPAPASAGSTPGFSPASASLSGRVVRITASGPVVDSAGREATVDMSRVVDVWKETSVLASAIEIGDDLLLNGTAGSPFIARYVWANIGRIDGVIRELDATGMRIDVQLRSGGSVLQRVDFSRYIEYGSPDATVKLTREDLVVGRAVGAVTYGRSGEPLRATRIW